MKPEEAATWKKLYVGSVDATKRQNHKSASDARLWAMAARIYVDRESQYFESLVTALQKLSEDERNQVKNLVYNFSL